MSRLANFSSPILSNVLAKREIARSSSEVFKMMGRFPGDLSVAELFTAESFVAGLFETDFFGELFVVDFFFAEFFEMDFFVEFFETSFLAAP
jgi:hypothetical protein